VCAIIMGCRCSKSPQYRVKVSSEDSRCFHQFPDDFYGVVCPFARLYAPVHPDFYKWEEKMIATFHAAWEEKASPQGACENDHNFNTKLGQGNTLGFLAAHLKLLPDIDEHLRHGIFQETSDAIPAIVRFSDFGSDRSTARMARMAVKFPLASAWAGEANLLLTESMDTFPLANSDHLSAFVGLASRRCRSFCSMLCSAFRVIVCQNFTRVVRGRAFQDQVLAKPFYSQLPYMLGDGQAMKFSLVPRQRTARGAFAQDPRSLPCTRKPRNSQEAEVWAADSAKGIAEYLSRNDAVFDLQVQVKDFGKSQDLILRRANVRWREKPITVGTLTIPKQTCNDRAVNTQLQSMLSAGLDVHPDDVDKAFVFHPVLTHEANRPIGEIQAFRAAFYCRHALERFTTLHEHLRTLQEGRFLRSSRRMPFEALSKADLFSADGAC